MKRPTPKALKILLYCTVGLCLFTAVFDKVFAHFGLPSPFLFLSLSTWGIYHGYVWQFLSYLFTNPLDQPLSFSLLLSMTFNTYLLWLVGSSLIDKKGIKQFFTLYFLNGLCTGAVVFLVQLLFHINAPFAGNSPILSGLLISWVLLFPKLEFFLASLQIRAKWIAAALLGINFLIDISLGNWLNPIAYTTSVGVSYFYCSIFWKKSDPISSFPRAKIYDFKTGRAIINDDEFMDAMLSKISMQGKSSLSLLERLRLRRIAKRKKAKR